jgi:hypothetical protein
MSQNKPTVGFWITATFAGLLLYPLSFGPACWIGERNGVGTATLSTVYCPIIWLASANRGPAARAILWYAAVGANRRADPYVSHGGELRWLYYQHPGR